MDTKTNGTAVKAFISSLADKNYKDANDCLQKVVELKLKERVKQVANTKNEQ